MSNPPLYGNVVPLDREAHKKLKLDTSLAVVQRVAGQNSLFLAMVEFPEAAKEFPIVFVRVGEAPAEGGKQAVAPLAVLGLKPGSNLFIKDDKWTGNYAPAYLRRYPFAMVRMEPGSDQLALCYDADWAGFSEEKGEALFNADGQPSEFLLNAKTFLENFEQEVERTRMACEELMALDLLQDMRFDATLPSGEKLEVDGFLALDEKKYAELSDEQVVRLHRNGLLSLLEMHRLSMGNMSRLAALHDAAKA
ncbi:MAG: SapC family protein [Burkholderiaceae bacterium]